MMLLVRMYQSPECDIACDKEFDRTPILSRSSFRYSDRLESYLPCTITYLQQSRSAEGIQPFAIWSILPGVVEFGEGLAPTAVITTF